MWRKWQRKTVFAVAGMMALAAGMLGQTVYAAIVDVKLSTRTTHETFAGISGPSGNFQEGDPIQVTLEGDRWVSRKNPIMDLTIVHQGTMTLPVPDTDCGGGVMGICINTRDQTWVFKPLLGGEFFVDGDKTLVSGEGLLLLIDGAGQNEQFMGMAEYNALIQDPQDPALGYRVMYDLSGFTAKVKEITDAS